MRRTTVLAFVLVIVCCASLGPVVGAAETNTGEIANEESDQLVEQFEENRDVPDGFTVTFEHSLAIEPDRWTVDLDAESETGLEITQGPVTTTTAIGRGTTIHSASYWGDSDESETSISPENSSIEVGTFHYYRDDLTRAPHVAEDVEEGYVDLVLEDSSATVSWEGLDGDTWETVATNEVSESGEHTTDLSAYGDEYHEWRVEIDLERDSGADDWNAEILEDGVRFENDAPELSNASPDDEFLSEFAPTLEIDVDDEQFDTVQGDQVDVEFRDGDDELIHEETIIEADRVVAHPDSTLTGENEWYVAATDAYGGQTVSETFTFEAPDEIEIRDEQTQELIAGDDANVEVRFFVEEGGEISEDEVITRETGDGTVDMGNLPANQEFVVLASAEGYEDRRIIVENIYRQNAIYLLDEDADSVLNEFVLEDRTGDFDSSETRMYIERPLPAGDDEEYQIIAGDYFGAHGQFTAILERGERYRLTVENTDGDSRVLGSHTPETDDILPLEVGNVPLDVGEDDAWTIDAGIETIEGELGGDVIAVRFLDRGDSVDRLEYSIYERHNESNLLTETEVTDPTRHQQTYPLTDDEAELNWHLEYAVIEDDPTEPATGTIPIGGVGPLDWPIDGSWLAAFALFAIVGVATLFGGSMSRTGAVVTVVVAFGLTAFGAIDIPYSILVFAGMVALVFKFADAGSPQAYPP